MKYGMFLALPFLASALISAAPAQAAGGHCYSPEQARAERLLRLHSELMVITVTCHQGSTGRDLVSAYTGFTRNNIEALHAAEATLTEHYKATYGGKGVDRLDRLRTQLANEYGQEIADKSAPVFCGERRDMVTSFYESTPAAVDRAVDQLYVADRTYEPVCGATHKKADKEDRTPLQTATRVAYKAK